jgi:hypothetical protein
MSESALCLSKGRQGWSTEWERHIRGHMMRRRIHVSYDEEEDTCPNLLYV